MSTVAELYTEKAASAERELLMARQKLAQASSIDAFSIEREVALLEALIPLLRKTRDFLKSLPQSP